MQAWQATVQDNFGNAVISPSVTVYQEDGVTLASIFNEDESPKDNPFMGSLEGFVQFWANPGVYKIVGANGPDETQEWSASIFAAYDEIQAAAAAAAASAADAADSADAAAAAADSVTKPNPESLAELLASTYAYPVGMVVSTRLEEWSFEVVPAPAVPDLTTAGGILLRALPDDEGFVHIEQYGAVPDANRLTGAGTDCTNAIRKAFATDHHIQYGLGTYRVTETIWNIKENRIVRGAGKGMATSSPDTVTKFNPPCCILATNGTTADTIQNYAFSNGLTNWTLEGGPATATPAAVVAKDTGSPIVPIATMPTDNALRFTGGTGVDRFVRADTVPVKANKIYTAQMQYFLFAASGQINWRLEWLDASMVTIGSFVQNTVSYSASAWQIYSTTVTAPPTAAFMRVLPDYLPGAGTQDAYLTDLRVRETVTAARRVITRRKRRATSADPNDAPMSAVLENWGAGSEFKDFSIELFCDYTDTSPTNYGSDWDIGFYNGCRSHVTTERVSILGYFRRAGFYWDVTDGFAIPQLLDPLGVQMPGPGDPRWTGRSSGADHCRMVACEVRGARVGRAILGAEDTRQAGDVGYYDWVSGTTIAQDNRGVSGCSDFRSHDCIIYSANHHSGWRTQDPIGWGSPLTRANAENEADWAPAAQYIDVWASNDDSASGPANAARGIYLDDMRYVSFEMFRTRLGQVKEVIFGRRTWSESGDGLYDLHAADGTPLSTSSDYVNYTYGHLYTGQYTGLVVWENTVVPIFEPWVYDWSWTRMSDRWGRTRGQSCGLETAAAGANGSIKFRTHTGGVISIVPGGVGSGTVLPTASAVLLFDTASTPALSNAGLVGANVTLLAAETTPSNANTPDGNISFSAFPGEIQFRNRLAAGETILSWNIS